VWRRRKRKVRLVKHNMSGYKNPTRGEIIARAADEEDEGEVEAAEPGSRRV
jgi:hypothetical protein